MQAYTSHTEKKLLNERFDHFRSQLNPRIAELVEWVSTFCEPEGTVCKFAEGRFCDKFDHKNIEMEIFKIIYESAIGEPGTENTCAPFTAKQLRLIVEQQTKPKEKDDGIIWRLLNWGYNK